MNELKRLFQQTYSFLQLSSYHTIITNYTTRGKKNYTVEIGCRNKNIANMVLGISRHIH